MSAVPENQFYFWPRYDGNVALTDAARALLPALSGSLRDELAGTLPDIVVPPGDASPDELAEMRRHFFRALKAAAPQLPIDESFTESMSYNPFLGRTALYLTDRDDDRPASSIRREFARWEMIATIALTRRGLPLRQLRVFACTDYRQPEL